jgi:hypothetical protein
VNWLLMLPSAHAPHSPSLLQMVQLLLLLHTQPLSTKAPAVNWLLMLPSTPILDSPSPLLILRLLQQLSTKAACTCCQLKVVLQP